MKREDVLKRYFPVILKPIILSVLFLTILVWIYFSLNAVSPYWFIDRSFPPQVRAEEAARVRNLGSFLTNLLHGNFGYSFTTLRPVWDELSLRFPTTILLVGLSVFFSTLIGIGLSLSFNPSNRRPSALAHSFKGFFFGLVPFMAIPFMLLFSYCSYTWFGFAIFPLRGLHSLPPPADPFAYVVDTLWHLFLPVATLTLISVVRISLMIWSRGSIFTEKTLLKKILLPCTTIDFTVTISAVIIVEWIWTIPGVGRLLLTSLFGADYNALVGAFVTLVALAVGFGYVSVLLDFVQRLTGLHDDLEKKFAIDPEISTAARDRDFKACSKLLLKKKSVIIGSVIIVAFLVLAVSAPPIDPFDSAVGEDIFAQVANGAKATIAMVFLAASLGVISGFPLGLVSGYFQGWLDSILVSIIETWLVLPVLPIFSVVVLVFSRSWIYFVPVSLPFLFALGTMASRNEFLMRPSNQKFKGAAPATQLFNVFRDLLANFFLTAISAVLLLISIDFLGFGDPRLLTWGTLLYNQVFVFGGLIRLAWWQIMSPVICLGLFTFGLILLGTGLENESSDWAD